MSLSTKDDGSFPKNDNNKTTKSSLDSKLAAYRVYVVTWNVGSKFPDNISLRNLLGINSTAEDHHLPDIYALGLQEVSVHPQQQVLGLFKEDPWTSKAKDFLKEFDYVAVKSEQMQGLLLTIFVRRPHVPHLRDIESEFTRTGFGGIWGNKGAVSIRFNIYGGGLAFVVSHLAAHDHHLDERIEDFKQIMENHHYHVPCYREILEHDYVFWFGDLNFRLMGDDTSVTIREKVVKEEALKELLQLDQLNYIRLQTQEAFTLLHERMPAFPPTFKFKEGTSEYDLKRRPAWTDRILFAVKPLNKKPYMPFEIEQCAYKSHPGYNISDHRPVTSEFTIKLFPQYRAPCVKFKDIIKWTIGIENMVEYKKPFDFEERDHDWIGIYRVDYASLKEYVAYEYVNQAESPPSTPNTPDPFWDEGPSRHGHSHRRKPDRLSRLKSENEEIVRLEFSDDVELKNGEEYLLMYFQNTGLRGITSIAGISNIFKAQKIKSSPHFGNID